MWCAPAFREEHRAALDWLNEHTDEDTRFFGVEIAAVRIDSSRPAPLFRVVAKPNDWTKQVHTERAAVTLSPKSLAYQGFWNELLTRIRAEHPSWTRSTAGSSQSWITLGNKPVTMLLTVPVLRVLEACRGQRTEGPLVLRPASGKLP